jgi:hypothetical protein
LFFLLDSHSLGSNNQDEPSQPSDHVGLGPVWYPGASHFVGGWMDCSQPRTVYTKMESLDWRSLSHSSHASSCGLSICSLSFARDQRHRRKCQFLVVVVLAEFPHLTLYRGLCLAGKGADPMDIDFLYFLAFCFFSLCGYAQMICLKSRSQVTSKCEFLTV